MIEAVDFAFHPAHIDLVNVTITGGTIQGLDGGIVQTVGAGSVSMIDYATIGPGEFIVNDGTTLVLGSTVDGAIVTIHSTGADTVLDVDAIGVTLFDGATLALSDSAGNIVTGQDAYDTLVVDDATISGAGQLGNGQLTLINCVNGVIHATGDENYWLSTPVRGISVTRVSLRRQETQVLRLYRRSTTPAHWRPMVANSIVLGSVTGEGGDARINGGVLEFGATRTHL